jgi:hypothetical protein
VGDVVAAVQTLAQAEAGRPQRGLGRPGDRGRPHHRAAHLQLRERHPEAATEQPRPGAAREHDGAAGGGAFLGNHAGDAAGGDIEAAHGAVGQHLAAEATHGGSDGRRRLLRLGTAIACGVERARPLARRARQQRGKLRARNAPRIQLVGAGVGEKLFMGGGTLLVLGEIDDPGLAEAGIAFDRAIDAAPNVQGFHDERQLARVAALLAAEAPIATRLLAGNGPLLAERDRDTLLRQEERRRRPDDPAADDDDVDAAWQFAVGRNGLNTRGHADTPE